MHCITLFTLYLYNIQIFLAVAPIKHCKFEKQFGQTKSFTFRLKCAPSVDSALDKWDIAFLEVHVVCLTKKYLECYFG